jgi:hypothetical protein
MHVAVVAVAEYGFVHHEQHRAHEAQRNERERDDRQEMVAGSGSARRGHAQSGHDIRPSRRIAISRRGLPEMPNCMVLAIIVTPP